MAEDDGPERDASTASAPDLEAARADAAAWKERAMRARADYDNLHKRVTRDAQAERERAKARVIEAFLPLWDLAAMAAHQAAAHPGPLSEGVLLLEREFDRFAAREGVERVGTVGEPADPARHEILAHEAAEGVASGQVSRIVQPGYLVDGKVLRYAKVCVAP